jgi:hypothetical protein
VVLHGGYQACASAVTCRGMGAPHLLCCLRLHAASAPPLTWQLWRRRTDGPWPSSSSSPLVAAAAAAATMPANSAMGVLLMRGCFLIWLQRQLGGSAVEGQGNALSQGCH